MLKPSYDTQEAIPEDKRGAYVQKDGKWVLDELDPSHPVLVNNRALKSEKETAQSEAAAAKSDLANANIIPRGHVAVPKSDEDLIKKVKEHGSTEEVVAKLDEHKTLKTKVATQERRERLEKLRKDLGWNENSIAVLEMIPDLPDTEDREVVVNGEKKQVPHAKIKQGDEVTFKPFADYFAERHAALLPSVQAVTQPEGTPLPSHGAGGGSDGEDILTKRLRAQDAAQSANINPLVPKTAVAA